LKLANPTSTPTSQNAPATGAAIIVFFTAATEDRPGGIVVLTPETIDQINHLL
jgi:hypothetical protein